MTSTDTTTPGRGVRQARSAGRRAAILEAALAIFGEQGFAAARMEDVARRAGVAKGTIYLHFADKERLFEGIVRHAIVPVLRDGLGGAPRPGESFAAFLGRIGPAIASELRAGSRADVFRLLIAEGPRFPALTELYFRTVIAPAISRLEEVARAARHAGELADDTLERFPQLAFAPILLGVVWSTLFSGFRPLDTDAMVARQIELLFRAPAP